jgi:hypothetical protein
MSSAVSQLLDGLDRLSATERYEFLSMVAIPVAERSEDWTDDDFSVVGAQTFARLDAEEEEHGNADSTAR